MAAKKKAKRSAPTAAKARSPASTDHSAAERTSAASAGTDPRLENRVPVVGIGASAGGLDAFKKFFLAMPPESGIAFVLIPHLDPNHESLMAPLLARNTRMTVLEAAEGIAVEANHVYIIPPNKYMTIARGVLRLTGPVERSGSQTSIDLFLRSLAGDRQERAVCIILSGTGSHGTPGLMAVKAAGGMAMVQEPRTAEYAAMPQSAVATEQADHVLPVEKMPEVLVKHVQQFYGKGGAPGGKLGEDGSHLNQVLALLRARTKFDFRCYRKKMLTRRVERRMDLNHIDNLADYLARLREHPDEAKQLARDLLISVTSFFRDPEALQALTKDAIAPLIQAKSSDAPVRVWVPGCATGEEAYSLAILLIEELTKAQKTCALQIFATDVDEDALAVARQGMYPASISADVPADRLARFFTKADDSVYQISKPVREAVVFARQNLIADPPFSRVDLVSCRNVLIYLEPEVQSKVLTLLHFALHQRGYLFLGTSETIGRHTDLFEQVSKKNRIFRRIGPIRPEHVEFPIGPSSGAAHPNRRTQAAAPIRPSSFAELTQRLVLEEIAPAAVLINRKYEVLYFLGPTTRYLDVPTGEPTQDLLAMAREGLRSKLRGAIHQAIHDGQTVQLPALRIRRNGGFASITASVKPIAGAAHSAGQAASADGLLLVLFQEAAPAQSQAALVADEDSIVQQLEYELRATKDDLQSTIDEMASATEELRAANEEAMSMNEELQSANEELETSKEEMQSLNEELATVNSQLQEKVEELEDAGNDMANLLDCTDLAIVFLDAAFRIRRFTPPATRLLSVIASDVGRPISDITLKFADRDLMRDAGLVLRRLKPLEKEVQTDDGRCCIRRITPFRTTDNRVDGIVLTFLDVTPLKQAAAQEHLLAAVLINSNDANIVCDIDGRITQWNRGAGHLYGYTRSEALQMNLEALIPEKLRPRFAEIWERLKRGEQVGSFETQRIAKNGRVIDVSIACTALTDAEGRPTAIAKTDRDMTDRKANVQLGRDVEHRTAALQESEARLRAILNAPDDAIITIDHDGIIEAVNPAAEHMFGYAAGEMVGQNVKMLMPMPDRDRHDGYLKHYLQTGQAHIIGIGREVEARRKDGTTFFVDLAVSEVKEMKLFTGIIRDITRRKQLEHEVVEIAALEQLRIGEDLHDECGQELTALGLLAGSLAESLKERVPADSEIARKIGRGLSAVLRQVRNIAHGLALAEVTGPDLPDALAELASRLGETSGVRCVFDAGAAAPILDNVQATHLYHIAQEACTNALKHAEAENIAIRLLSRDNTIILEISDDGIGMSEGAKNGLGLRIMQNRASVIGAQLSIDRAKPKGTVVTCVLSNEKPHGKK